MTKPLLALLVPPLLLAAACRSEAPGPNARRAAQSSAKAKPGADQGRAAVLARVGPATITVGTFSDEIARQNPYVRLRFTSPERKKEFLKNMVRFEVLYQEARRRNLQKDPEVIQRTKRLMLDKLMEQLHTTLVKLEDITEREIQEYYQGHLSQYHQPPTVRASQVVTKTREEAQKVLERAKQKTGDVKTFGEMARELSIDAASKARSGDLDYFARDAKNVPKPVVEAAFAIPSMWALAGPIQTDAGFVVLMKTGEREGVDRTIDVERDRIRNLVFNEKRMKALEKYIEELQKKAKVRVFEENIGKVKIDFTQPKGGADRLSPMPDPHGRGGHMGRFPRGEKVQ
jgi:hypothetical protein